MTDIPPPVLQATPFRWGVGLVVMLLLGVLLLRAALTQGAIGQALMVAAGLAALALAWALLRAKGQSLHWQPAGLCDGAGQVIAARDQILAVERGALAMKPTQPSAIKPAVVARK